MLVGIHRIVRRTNFASVPTRNVGLAGRQIVQQGKSAWCQGQGQASAYARAIIHPQGTLLAICMPVVAPTPAVTPIAAPTGAVLEGVAPAIPVGKGPRARHISVTTDPFQLAQVL